MDTPQKLREKAASCRDLADTAVTEEARKVLDRLAAGYEVEALTLEQLGWKSSRPAFAWPSI